MWRVLSESSAKRLFLFFLKSLYETFGLLYTSFQIDSITVYQAYRPAIAIPAVENQKFTPPFKMERTTWIKPSFLCMMYRCD